MNIPVKSAFGEYTITLSRGCLLKCGELLYLNRKVLIVTDSGVPAQYAKTVASQCRNPYIITVDQGETSKSFESFKMLLQKLVENNFTRSDCIVAVGGGVVGDLAGFVASAYLRGIDFYNIPTTVLSQVDSSIGGKTAVDFCGLKNIVGAFYSPRAVIIDPDTLSTLPSRQISNGLSEAVKSALIGDKKLFELFERGEAIEKIDEVIASSISVKKRIVEADERESGARKALNFGHTVAHAIESACQMETYYHGECVAMGMISMCSEPVRKRLLPVLENLNLPLKAQIDAESLISAIHHDKKMSGEYITVVYVSEIGMYELKKIPFEEYVLQLREASRI